MTTPVAPTVMVESEKSEEDPPDGPYHASRKGMPTTMTTTTTTITTRRQVVQITEAANQKDMSINSEPAIFTEVFFVSFGESVEY